MITIRTSVASALIAITACAAAQDTGKTPAGAERAGNASGSIPAWPGNEVQQTGWSYGKLRSDNFKYKGDKSTLTIDASNADKYAAMLSPGQLAMLKQVKGYRMDVYPTRRTCGVPDFVAENTKKNAGGIAKIGPDGWSLQEAVVPGYPFPTPANGTEAMWNSKMRYRGVGVEYKNVVTSVSPRKGSTEWIRAGQEFTAFMPWVQRVRHCCPRCPLSNILPTLPTARQPLWPVKHWH